MSLVLFRHEAEGFDGGHRSQQAEVAEEVERVAAAQCHEGGGVFPFAGDLAAQGLFDFSDFPATVGVEGGGRREVEADDPAEYAMAPSGKDCG
jgi:hypothetical protein